ncbi:hypothetical protein DdX_22140 [Ditylenchus destructor]|uniref:Uncharacterized protein n=1 Tax=Ditylenchus destructor TaxID=166010 RepID=A0AAD4QSP2_9BILA|nr:hypothetical protein DdX_22140 [Ditylenchus destructor]
MILPVRTDFTRGPYLLRTSPERRDEVLKGALAALEHNEPQSPGAREADLRGTACRLLQERPLHGRPAGDGLRSAAGGHRAGHRRPGQLLGAAAQQADRHPPRIGRHPRADPALLPDRELPAGHAGNRAGHAGGVPIKLAR